MKKIQDKEMARLEKEIAKLCKELEAFDDKTDMGDYPSFEGWCAARSPWTDKIGVLDQKVRMMKIPKYEKIPDYGDVMALEDFVECCEDGGFIDYDGHGYYATEDKMTDILINPSDITEGDYRKEFPQIVWFNK